VSTASPSERYDEALDHLLAFRPAVIPATRSLLAEAPDFPMGWVLAGYLGLSSTDAADVRHARTALDTLDALGSQAGPPLAPREAAHRDVLAAWVGGDWHGAAALLDDLLVRWPDDLLGLMMGHQLDFFVGDAQNLRDRVGRSLHAADPADPRHGFVRGMYAFGLEESGHYGLAREHGLAALDRNPGDVWALHAVVHTYEMEGRVDEGLRLMRARSDDWAGESLFSVHNWWHFALYLLEAGLVDEVLGVYDAQIHNASSPGVPLEMLDASALLWRLLLDGIDTGGRFGPLAEAWGAWCDRAGAEPWYVFNDLHAVLASAGAGRHDEARAVVERLDRYVAGAARRTSNVVMTAEIGLPACRAVVAFADGRYDDVVGLLMPIRRVLQRFGGSHAQRDVLQRTLLDAAIRSGRAELAEALVSERLAVRGTSVYALGRWAELLRGRDDAAAAERAEADAATHRSRFAAAAAAAAA
jgi:hypothetical protein